MDLLANMSDQQTVPAIKIVNIFAKNSLHHLELDLKDLFSLVTSFKMVLIVSLTHLIVKKPTLYKNTRSTNILDYLIYHLQMAQYG